MIFKSESCRVLIVAPSWIGDLVMAQALYRLLKNQNPAIKIDVLVPAFAKALLLCMREVDEIIISSFQHGELKLIERYRLGKMLRAKHYQQAIVLPNSFKSALIPFFAKIPKRTGWRGEWRYGLLNDCRILSRKKYPLMVEQFMALGFLPNTIIPKPYLLPEFFVKDEQLAEARVQFQLEKSRRLLALCIGAQYGLAKEWPPEYFAAVAKSKLEEGFAVCLLGTKADEENAEIIQKKTGAACNSLVGKTTLMQAICVLASADLVVTNDSGLMHVAAALKKKIAAVYGSSSPDFTPPLGDLVQILSLHLSCSPCFKRKCPLGHYRCLRDLHPELVLNAIKILEGL